MTVSKRITGMGKMIITIISIHHMEIWNQNETAPYWPHRPPLKKLIVTKCFLHLNWILLPRNKPICIIWQSMPILWDPFIFKTSFLEIFKPVLCIVIDELICILLMIIVKKLFICPVSEHWFRTLFLGIISTCVRIKRTIDIFRLCMLLCKTNILWELKIKTSWQSIGVL